MASGVPWRGHQPAAPPVARQVGDALAARADAPARVLWHIDGAARVERFVAAIQFHGSRAAKTDQQHVYLGIDVRFKVFVRQQPNQIDVEVRADYRPDDARSLLLFRLGLAGGEIKALRM